jgi:hypothetical protein
VTYLLMPRRTAARITRRLVGQAVAGFNARMSEFRAPVVQPTTRPAAEPADVFAPADLPEVADIEAAASLYFRAADQARTADRAKRKARKILDLLPVGRHGAWEVTREPSGRETVDLDAVRKLFKQHGLGPVPMKQSAPSLKVHKAETSTVVTTVQPTVYAVNAEPTTGACARCDRTWPLSDLSEDGNGDPVCCDCHASDPGDDRAAHRDYAYSGR